MTNEWRYDCIVEKVIDGDTIDVNISLGFDVWKKERIRFDGINTPESRTKDKREKEFGLKVKAFVKKKIEGKEVEIETVKQEKYGRYLGRVFIAGECLNDLLVKKGYAREYHGEKRGKWFKEE